MVSGEPSLAHSNELLMRKFRRAVYSATSRKDWIIALVTLRQMCKRGMPRAIYALGTWYLHGGRALPKNRERGLQLIARASRLGDPLADYDLGVAYYTGRGRKRSLARARRLFLRAAIAGDLDAADAVGTCLFFGDGGPIDMAAGVVWWRRAARRGHRGAARSLAACYSRGDGVRKNSELARTWGLRAAAAKARRSG